MTGGRGTSDLLMPSEDVYDSDYWNKEKGPRRLRPEQERYLDTKRFDRLQPKFDQESYRKARPSEKELHCSDCDVWVKTKDQMQAHKEGKEHRKRTAKVQVFECKLCLISVPCQDTLNNHMKGKSHIKKAKELHDERKARGEITGEWEEGYMTGPLEMARLDNNEREELRRLRKEVVILQGKYKEILRDREDLRRQVRFCRDNHHPGSKKPKVEYEDKKPKVEYEDQKPSTSHLHRSREYFEYGEKDFDIKFE